MPRDTSASQDGQALRATLHAHDSVQQQVCYQVFRDLLDLFRRRDHQ